MHGHWATPILAHAFAWTGVDNTDYSSTVTIATENNKITLFRLDDELRPLEAF